MRRITFRIFLIIVVFANCVLPQTALAGQSDSVAISVTVLDSPPAGTIVINNGDDFSNSTSVNLTLSAWDVESAVTEMQFSNDALTWSEPEPYATTKTWTLPAEDGEKTVYVKFKDTAGNWSGEFSDTIILDLKITTNIVYTYDDLNRLTNAAYGGPNAAYTYDEVGNIVNRRAN